MPIIDTKKEAISKWGLHVKTVMEKANKASHDFGGKLSKEEKALEALIKIVVELEDTVTSYHVTDETLKYAHEALKANGWEVYLDKLTRAHYRKVDA